jgi:hypothetical protein
LVDGSVGVWPEQKRKPLAATAWLYGPIGAGASGAVTGRALLIDRNLGG